MRNINNSIFLALIIFISSSKLSYADPFCSNKKYETTIEISNVKIQKSKGAFIVIHGLNQKPSTMKPLNDLLNKLAYDTYNISLIGHFGESIHGANKNKWIQQVKTAWCMAKKAHAKQIKLLGFSMGGALSVNFVDSIPEAKIDGIILFAPAIDIKFFGNLLYPLVWLRHINLSLPSFTPKYYQENSFTSFDTYKALLDLESGAQDIKNRKNFSVPTLILQDPEDGLVSYSGLKKWIKKYQLKNWRIIEINSKAKISGLKNHMLIDKQGLGEKSWAKVTKEVTNFLEESDAK